MHFSHLCGKLSTAALYSSLLRWCKEAVAPMLILSSDSNCLPQRCSFTSANKQLSHGVRSTEQNVPTPPGPSVALDSAQHNGDEVLHCPGAKWHHAQAVLVVYGEWLISSYPARECSNIGQWLFYQMAWGDLAQVHFGWRTSCAWPAEHPHCAMQCSSSVTLGQAIRNSVVAAEAQMNVIKECIAFICPMLQMGGGKKNTHDFLVIVEHMWNPLCKNFSISPSSWWGYSKHLERFWLLWQLLAWNTAYTFKEMLACSTWCSSVADAGAPPWGASPVSSWPFLIAFTHQQTVSYEEACVPKPYFMDV